MNTRCKGIVAALAVWAMAGSVFGQNVFGEDYIAWAADTTYGCRSKRPPIGQRLFRSQAVENKLAVVKDLLRSHPRLAQIFENCYPNTLDTTVHYRKLPNGEDDTFVYTGDIPAMWLRDSSAQVWPYVELAKEDAPLRAMLRGLLLRQFKCIGIDPYANAFNDGPTGEGWQSDGTEMRPEVHERKYEIDSNCYPIRLAYHYWKTTGDTTVFGKDWLVAVDSTLHVFRSQQRKNGRGTYRFYRKTERAFDTVGWGGQGAPTRPVGLVASLFRPSDDATVLPFLIPSNFMAMSSLRKAAAILDTVNRDRVRATACRALAAEIEHALAAYAVYPHHEFGEIYAYEVDGFGNQLLMDDPNIPSLLALPYMGDVALEDPRYQNTRRFLLSASHPCYFEGKAGEGIGGPHVGVDMIWPMSIMMRAFTSTDDEEIKHCINLLIAATAQTGFMHESFHKDDVKNYTRPWFAWQNTLFGELIIHLIDKGKLNVLLATHE